MSQDGRARRKAQASMVSLALYSAVVVVGISTVVFVGQPVLEDMRDAKAVDNAKDMLSGMQEQIASVAGAGEGSETVIGLRFSRGDFVFDATRDEIRYELETDAGIVEPHSTTRIGGLQIGAMTGVTVEKDDVNGQPCWRLENDHVRACIRNVPRNKTEQIGTGTVGYWRFNENGGSTAEDSSGQGNDGSINGAQWTDGRQKSGLRFDGDGDYVAATVPQDVHTAAFWARPTGGAWTHYANVTGTWYENGQLQNVTNTYYRINGNTVEIGRNGTGGSDHFNGTIDEVRVYNRSLNADEVQWLYEQQGALDYIDTRHLLLEYVNKDANRSLDADMGVTLQTNKDIGFTNNGTGYTTPDIQGDGLGEGTVTAHINSFFGIDYNVKFSLLSGADFVKINVEES